MTIVREPNGVRAIREQDNLDMIGAMTKLLRTVHRKTIFVQFTALPLILILFATNVYGQVVHSLDLPSRIAGIKGSAHLLFLRDSKELSIFAPREGKLVGIDYKKALEGFDTLTFTPSGSVLVSREDDENIRVFKLNQELERSDFATLPKSEFSKPYTLVANESDTVLWVVSTESAVAIDVESNKVIRRVKSYSLSSPSPRTDYLASRKELLVASFVSLGSDDGWRVELFRENSDRIETLLTLKRTLLLSLLTGPNGELLVCAREDLHGPNTGHIACYEPSTFAQKWKVDAVFPLSGSILNELIWIDDGSRFLQAYRLKDGTLAHKVDVNKNGLHGLAVVNDPPTVFSLSSERTRLHSFKPVEK